MRKRVEKKISAADKNLYWFWKSKIKIVMNSFLLFTAGWISSEWCKQWKFSQNGFSAALFSLLNQLNFPQKFSLVWNSCNFLINPQRIDNNIHLHKKSSRWSFWYILFWFFADRKEFLRTFKWFREYFCWI